MSAARRSSSTARPIGPSKLASIKAVAAGIPGARLVLLDDLGHRPDIRRPDIVNPILARFLGDDEA
ncbi:MAG: hypothetical protein H0V36_08000 [Chloroflexi bacterium]|nr:hypothetical protein [Chloroflexota bacterium]